MTSNADSGRPAGTSGAGSAGAPTGEPVGTIYARRLEARKRQVEGLVRTDRRIGDARLLLFGATAVIALAGVLTDAVSPWWSIPFLLAFFALVLAHEPARRRLDRARRAAEFYERGLTRLADHWHGTGVSGVAYLDEDHPFAADLDLFGEGSLFERLCLTRSRAGEALLASWLKSPAAPGTVRERQEAARELQPCLDLREDLALLGTEEQSGIDPDTLARWGDAGSAFRGPRAVRIGAGVLGMANLAALVVWFVTDLGLLPLFGTVMATLAFARTMRARVAQALAGLERSTRDLVLLAGILDRIEQEHFDTAMLTRLRARLETGGRPASVRIRRLARLLHLLETGHNQFFMPIAALLAWRTHLSVVVDAWRAENGPCIRDWVEAAAEFEAICSIAAYAAENPDHVFPRIVEGGARFEADSIGHPLIPASECIRNDVRLGDPVRVLLVSGSNMSGKSTMLRTVGTNAVLAFAGAPVRAARLTLSPLAPGATLRIQDSLREGRSRFYAEITRVRRILDLSRDETPVLFLFDEIFHGTNSSDRRIGAEAVLATLIRAGAIGLATTHDLALAEMADTLGSAAMNVHFADTLVDGELHFDYRMKPGVVEHSNALALMRSVGLEV